ncbi:hypothetical protein PA25_28930 [Pseudoalteromonas sp. A25]|uniref:hypothetical protein n=1 Tax=Pseudoalteromonas sp. A25 TaxID=116092 RepID=UPI0012607560|nr:hypothetical protein [Pseudoalteromonas sp. A25]BBN82908.1 hypothetical protein PA25_28930 [Pseudoalteromonas sp. A25]
MKKTSMLLGVTLVAGCHHLATSQDPWAMTQQGLTYQGELIDQQHAQQLVCSRCEIKQQTTLTPLGPSNYTKLYIDGQLKALWGETYKPQLFVPNNVGRTLIPLKAGLQANSWHAQFGDKQLHIYSAQPQPVTLGAADYTIFIAPTTRSNRFTYTLLVN